MSGIKLLRLNEYSVNKAWASSFVRPHVIKFSTYDVSHMINFTRLFPFFSVFRSHAGRAWERRIPRPLNCFQKQRVGYRVGQGFVFRNASRNTRGRVQGEVLLVLLISCLNEATAKCNYLINEIHSSMNTLQ